MLLIVSNVVIVAALTEMEGANPDWFYGYELVSVCVFLTEYLLRMWTAVEEDEYAESCIGRLRWATSPINLLDFIALFPFIIDLATPASESYAGTTVLRLIRLLRMFSLLRLERGFGSMARIQAVLTRKAHELLTTVFVATVLLVISSSLVYAAESSVNEEFSSMGTALWWGVAALTTVGYGDVSPITPLGRVLGALTAFVGIGFFALPAGIIGSGFVEVMMDEKRSGMLQEVKGLVESEIVSAAEAAEHVVEHEGVRLQRRLSAHLHPTPPPSPPSLPAMPRADPLPQPSAVAHTTIAEANAAELALLRQAAAALRRSEPLLALCLMEERMRSLDSELEMQVATRPRHAATVPLGRSRATACGVPTLES